MLNISISNLIYERNVCFATECSHRFLATGYLLGKKFATSLNIISINLLVRKVLIKYLFYKSTKSY